MSALLFVFHPVIQGSFEYSQPTEDVLDGRPGLQGMVSGFVDRQWAKHHYRRWYREHHEPQ